MSQPLRLLMVEDSPADATLLPLTLRGGGYEVESAVVDNSIAMRLALEHRDWDLITSDHAMPNFSAPAALALAKELRPEVPFIVVSGEIDLDLAVSLMKGGALDYVRKQELPRLVPTIQRVLREVEARRKHQLAVHALEDSEARYRRLFETAQDGILILDADTGQILDVNPFLIKMLGYSKEEFLGKQLWEIGAFPDTEASKLAFAELQSKGYVRYEDLPLESSTGQKIAVEFVSNVYLVNHAKVAQCNIRDITTRALAEADIRELTAGLEQRVQGHTAELRQTNADLQHALNAKNRFLGIISHELRTPLNAIIGFSGTLLMRLSGPLTDEQEKQLRTVQTSGRQLLSLVNDMLDLTRIESGDIELRPEPVALQEIIEQVAGELRPQAQVKKLRFVTAMTADPVTLHTDRKSLLRILINLADNAVKFTAQGSVTIKLLRRDDRVPGVTEITVTDTGIGIRPEDQAKVFDLFSQVDDATTRSYEGAGLGLHLSQKLAHLLGGNITVKSEHGLGSVFALTF